ncbi:alpha/beta-hydrolase [Byssothecium circinans]|uniref:Alpha/beta-hydrolase n=1 Tax=Byssothecium circinans TaxID=147558 RepID=A0A6A5TJZ5_9PLEO|nr:alpha/beta-hydrolase [Byssothecium circinans]
MAAKNTAFLFVPGAWCPGYYFHKVTEKLEAQGYETKSIDNATLGKQEIAPPLEDDLNRVRSVAASFLDRGKDLVIVASSYGGFVTSESCKTLVKSARKDSPGELKHIVLLGSVMPEVGERMKDLVERAPLPESADEHSWVEVLDAEQNYQQLFGSLPEDEGLKYGKLAKAQSMRSMFEPLTFAAYEHVPTTMVIPGRDLVLPPEFQDSMFERAVKRGVKGLRKVVLEEGDHLPMLNVPDECVRICLEAAA